MQQNLQINPQQAVVVKTDREFASLKAGADASERNRTLQMLNTSYEAELHTMINVIKRGSYAVPHVHWIEKADGTIIKKGESFLALEGKGKVVLFNKAGSVEQVITLSASEHTMVWIPAGVWHTVVSMSPYLVLFENKTGPWKEGEDKVFHPAFPEEEDPRGYNLVEEWESLE